MTNFAYLRVSTSAQDIKNQKLGILDYCNAHHITPVNYIEDTAGGKVPWKQRAIGKILTESTNGDVIVASEISRLGRSALQVLEILELAAKKQISVHIAKNNLVMDDSLQSTITATILGLAAQIEREFISVRTKEALSRRKKEGIKLGRPKGQAERLKLDNYHDEIISYIKKGINKRDIARLIECSPSTLYQWLKRRHVQLK